jgi:hypothetical protein
MPAQHQCVATQAPLRTGFLHAPSYKFTWALPSQHWRPSPLVPTPSRSDLFVFCVQVDSRIEVISISCLTDMRVASPPHQGQPLAVPASPPASAFCRSSGCPGAGTGFSFADGTEGILAHAPAPPSGRPHHARRPLALFSLSSLVPSLWVRPLPNYIFDLIPFISW